MFQRILIANRGAIARRIVETCEDLGIESVAVFSDADEDAPHLEQATSAVRLPGNTPAQTYLNRNALLDAVLQSGADAVHPGYGFLAENADFAEAVTSSGATFVGPAARWLKTMGDKVAARTLMQENGFPTFPGSPEIADLEDARERALEIGYPIMLKPSAGGGGIGMCLIREEQELENTLNRTRDLAEKAFANGSVYLEKWLENPRHIEFQLVADQHGNAAHLFERECSIQRRHQKVIEETPAPGLDPAWVAGIAERAAAVVGTLGYDNIGTLETLVSAEDQYGFLEMNTRIQVEHAVTEVVTGVDLVALQISLAAGEPLPQLPGRRGFAVEARVYADDPQTGFPSTGRLHVFRPPELFGVRVDTGYREGQVVTPFYDALLAKVIGSGATREQAIGRVLVALRAFVIRGVASNIALLLRVLEDKAFLRGDVHTGYLADLQARPPG